MFKTIFGKQFVAFVSTVIVCLAVLGFGLSGMFKGYFIDQKAGILAEQGSRIAGTINRAAYAEFDKFIINPLVTLQINEILQSIHEYIEVSLFVTNIDFNVWVSTTDLTGKLPQKIDNPAFAAILEGQTVTVQGKVNGLFTEDVLTVATPILSDGQVKGAVFLVTSMQEVQEGLKGVASITFMCILAAGIISFVLIYITSRTISSPIHEISEAAKVIANGDFEKRLNVKTRDEVGQLAESFNNMAASLEDQEKHRREFIANISHDLRSPLTSMRGFLQAIIDGTIPPERQEHYLNIVMEETDRLSKLANDVLDISKIQNMEIELNRSAFDINELIRKTVIMLETRITNKEIGLQISFANDCTPVYADYEKIQRVIYNLLDNAIKFIDLQGQILVETSLRDDHDQKIYIKIKDDGKGISPEDQKRVFERFYKADISRGEDKKGSGLGLSIVKEFIKVHDESITLASEPGKGCEFTFSLPLGNQA